MEREQKGFKSPSLLSLGTSGKDVTSHYLHVFFECNQDGVDILANQKQCLRRYR